MCLDLPTLSCVAVEKDDYMQVLKHNTTGSSESESSYLNAASKRCSYQLGKKVLCHMLVEHR